MVSGRGGKRGRGGGVDNLFFLFFLVTVHQKAFLSEREAEREEAEDVEEKMRERGKG